VPSFFKHRSGFPGPVADHRPGAGHPRGGGLPRFRLQPGRRAGLTLLPGTLVTARSSLYRTEPVGYNDQPEFLNGVAGVKTALAPLELLEALKAIERSLGRREG
jgi:hypothetical protein